jgi:hypothetical protein
MTQFNNSGSGKSDVVQTNAGFTIRQMAAFAK